MKKIKEGLDASVSSLAQGIIPLRARKVILCYHRLCHDNALEASPFHNPVHTTPLVEFKRQIQWLSSFCEFKPLDDLLNDSESDDKWQIAVSFDDGYRDNLELGLPVLSEYKIPATLFITTAYTEDPTLIPWWDMCNYLRNTPGQQDLAETLKESSQVKSWSNIEETGSLNHRLCEELTQLNTGGPFSKASTLNHLVNKALNQLNPLLKNEMMRPDELYRLSQSPLVTIGSHTHTHPNLALLSEKEQKAELVQAILRLDQWNIRSLNWFAYPYGKNRHHTRYTRELLAELGITAAVTTNSGYISSVTGQYDLPRFSIDGRWNMQTFKARVLAGPFMGNIRKKLRFTTFSRAKDRKELEPDGQ